jgi:hypothetical protein
MLCAIAIAVCLWNSTPYRVEIASGRNFGERQVSKGVWVAWQGGGQRFVSRVFELSMGGVFIPTADQPPLGTVVKLIFEVPGGDVHAPAVVRHIVVGLGMGVEFATMDEDDLARIHQLLNELVR